MYLTRHATAHGLRWAADDHFVPTGLDLAILLKLSEDRIRCTIEVCRTDDVAVGALRPPVEPHEEVRAAGATYLRSCVAHAGVDLSRWGCDLDRDLSGTTGRIHFKRWRSRAD